MTSTAGTVLSVKVEEKDTRNYKNNYCSSNN